MTYPLVTLWALAAYLLLTAGSGPVLGLWSEAELLTGVVVALLAAVALVRVMGVRPPLRALNPISWVLGLLYVVLVLFIEMAKANLDVAVRVITGRVRPGIVRVRTAQTTDVGTLFVANSITLTPGTLTVDVDEESNDLYVHVIHLSDEDAKKSVFEPREIFTFFDCPAWIRRIVG